MSRRIVVLFAFLLLLTPLYADAGYVANGSTYYGLGTGALEVMTREVLATMGYVVGILYAIASLTAIYNATVIYVKLQAGEDGFVKSVMMLVGAVLFLIGATIVMPAFFGYSYAGGNAWG